MGSGLHRVKLDPQHRQMEWLLSCNDIYSLYHFTLITNLRQIIRKGMLCSRDTLAQQGVIHRVTCGGDNQSHRFDDQLGNSSYVSLSFRPRLPMAFEKEQRLHLCYLVFNSRVTLQSGVMFTDQNAASKDAQRAPGLAGLELVQFDALNTSGAWNGSPQHAHRQAEVLVPVGLSLSALEYVAFRSQSRLEEGKRLCEGMHSLPAFRVQPELFHLRKKDGFGCIMATLVNRHPYRPGINRVVDRSQVQRILAGAAMDHRPLVLDRGVSVIQSLIPRRHITLRVIPCRVVPL